MIMKKRLLSLLLIGCFVITAVAGCGDKTEESETNEATEIEETEEQSTVQTDIFNQAEHLNVALQPIPGYLPITVLQDKGWLQEALAEAGYEDIFKQSLITLTEMQKLMGKDDFNEILGDLIYKPPGKPTLVPVSDKRPAMNVTNAINEFDEIKEDE